jgi:hypothetical protein
MISSNQAKQKLMAVMRELAKAQERSYEALFTEENPMEVAAYLYEAEQSAEAALSMIREIREKNYPII